MTPSTLAGSPQDSLSHVRQAFDLCAAKIRHNLPELVTQPTSWAFDKTGDYPRWNEGFFEIGNWTTSFFTGMGILAYLDNKDEALLKPLFDLESLYQEKVTTHAAETMHDLGFLYSLYAVPMHIVTGEERFQTLGIKAAEVLADRFVPEGNYIRAWGRMDETSSDYSGLAIIDCLMNLPLLHWATDKTGRPEFRDIAIRHCETTLENFHRSDNSVYHSYRFNPVTGEAIGGDNYCGRGVESHWARGTTWAMYGFALGYRHTRDARYLDASLAITREFLSLLDDEVVPVWDFCLQPGEPLLRDSSAAAIAICALQELDALGHADAEMLAYKQRLLSRLCSEDYLDTSMECRGILKQGEVGDGVGKARTAYTSWGDYYFMEALARENGITVNWW